MTDANRHSCTKVVEKPRLNRALSQFLPIMWCLLQSLSVQAADDGRSAVLILDASGSMWGQIEGARSKIEVAREVMGDYFLRRAHQQALAVVVYGHRKRGDCADIEVVAPTGIHDAASLSSRLSKISPRGMTPIAESLRIAAGQIPRNAESADIILVTDGLETCNADPCSAAAELMRDGINIRAHVVGFGLTEDQATALSCITEQTGGQLLRPQSGDELASALGQISTAPTAESAPVSEKFFEVGPRAEAGHSYSIRYRREARSQDFAGFAPRGEGRQATGPSFGPIGGGSVGNNPFTKRAPSEPGAYDLILVASDGNTIIARQPIEVVPPANGFDPVGTVEPSAKFAITWRGPNQLGERVVIARDSDAPGNYHSSWGYAMSGKGSMRLNAPSESGIYQLRYLSSDLKSVMFSRAFGVGVTYVDADTTTSADLATQAAAATRATAEQDAIPRIRVTFRVSNGHPEVPRIWTARSADSDSATGSWASTGKTVLGEAEFEPGNYLVTAMGDDGREFVGEVEIAPGGPNRFEIEPSAREGHENRSPPKPVTEAHGDSTSGGDVASRMRALGGIPLDLGELDAAQVEALLVVPAKE